MFISYLHLFLDTQNALPEHVQDIEDPNHLSLEEEKWRSAEEKHLKVTSNISLM